MLLDNLISAILLVRANRMPKDKTQLLDKFNNNKTDKSQSKSKYVRRKHSKITMKKYCNNYKNDYLGKQNKALYDSCKSNQYCRKTKCKDIDRKFDKIKNRYSFEGEFNNLKHKMFGKTETDLLFYN